MAGTKLVAAQAAPRVGEAGGLMHNMGKEVVVGDLGRLHIPMEAVKVVCGRGCLMGRPVTARAGEQDGQEMGQGAKTSVNQHQLKG